ncbi:transposase domain-containing protein [uncultured Ornithinimicrobium sp.]|uniref:transposase domain-containing protein n=1 Tax=uncultured Ornithinimicrobium sp. TaxID=259307 RepID=UPI002594B615|nr:transposase domain-containing protein [uncultured Ornithinimicrobium sp.]
MSAPADPFAAGHLGELTQIVSVDLVDAAIDAAGAAQKRVRRLPTRVVVYLLLAAVLFADVGYRQVMGRLVAGAGSATGVPGSSALSQALRRIGIAPLRELFDLLRGPAAGSPRWRGLLVCAIDGTTMSVPDTAANAAAFGRQTGRPDTPAGYPMLRLVVRATAAWAGVSRGSVRSRPFRPRPRYGIRAQHGPRRRGGRVLAVDAGR